MAVRPRRVSKPHAAKLLLALAPTVLACGSSSHQGNSVAAEAQCKAPSFDITAAGLPYSLLTVQFSDFTGGVPKNSPSSVELQSIRGLQFELACPKSTPCVVDLTFGTLNYFTL